MPNGVHYQLIGLIVLAVAVLGAPPLQKTKCLDEYRNEGELIHAIQRSDACTMVAYGALWDGLYRAWSESGLWERLADEFCKDPSVKFGFYHYSGGTDVMSIPTEAGVGYTLGNFDVHAYRGGRHYGKVPLRRSARIDLKDVTTAIDVVLGTECYYDAQEKKSQSLLMLGLPAIIAMIFVCCFVLGYRQRHNHKTKM